MAGFALAKYHFLGRQFIFLLIISVLLIPLQVLMVPVFLILKTLGWINSLIGIIIPPAATATGTFMMRQYIIGIPDELLEAARIDGASDWKIYLARHSAIVGSGIGSGRDLKLYLALERLPMAPDRH